MASPTPDSNKARATGGAAMLTTVVFGFGLSIGGVLLDSRELLLIGGAFLTWVLLVGMTAYVTRWM